SRTCAVRPRWERRASACSCVRTWVLPRRSPLKRNVVVGGLEIGVGRRLGAGRDELVLATAGFAAAAEELNAVGDHFDSLALRTVLRVPLAPLEAAVDRDRAALREVLRAVLALLAPHSDVEVVRLLGPLAGRAVLAARVHGDPQAADRR